MTLRTTITLTLAALFATASLGLAQDKPAGGDKKPAAQPDKAKPAAKADDQAKPAGEPKEGAMSPEEKAKMANMMPGPVHQQWAKRCGEYTTKTKFAMTPDAEPTESSGTSKISSVLDGRFFSQESQGVMMSQSYTSIHLWGYNNTTKQYESVWTYTMSTSMMTMTGTSKDDGKTIDYTATVDGESGGKKTLYVTLKFIDDDHHTIKLWGKNPDGTPSATMETTYTRKK